MVLGRLSKALRGSDRRESEDLFAEIAALGDEYRSGPDVETARRLLRLRHLAGIRMLAEAGSDAAAGERPAPSDNGSPETTGAAVTPELLRASIAAHGHLVIRGLIGADEARELAGSVESIFAAVDGERPDPTLYDPFEPEPDSGGLFERGWAREAGVLWLADTPMLAEEVLDAYERAGLRSLLTAYLGGRPVISVNKSGLRRATPDVAPTWHQDGAFMGRVLTANVWLALTPCGEDAPGLAFVPKRLDTVLPSGTEGAAFDWSVSPAVAEEAAGELGIARPVFQPGDAVVFDDLFLHAPGSAPGMTKTRYALESWFFSPGGFPSGYVPLAF